MHSLPKVAVAGIGGFAAAHHEALRELEAERAVRVVATCDPRERQLGDLKERFDFAGRGVAVYDDFAAMLDAAPYDWISLATPINFHAPMHAAAVQRRLPCYLEKPPTLDPTELEDMIAEDENAIRQTQVGFAFTYEPERLRVKERLLAGEFGRLLRVSVVGTARRDRRYYERNSWAGRLTYNEALVLDSCLGNAMAHYVHNVLFFAGVEKMDSWAACRQVEARLFRANPIESADTVFLRGELEASMGIRVALTHACDTPFLIEEEVVCENATIRLRPGLEIVVQRADGSREVFPILTRNHLKENLRIFNNYVSGASHTPLSTLVHCRPFVHLNALAYLSTSGISPVTPPISEFVAGENRWRIPGIEPLLRQFVDTGDFGVLSQVGAPHTMPSSVGVSDLQRLKATVSELARSS
jgi:predicted dehydrogenase